MKRLFISIIVLVFSLNAFCQVVDESKLPEAIKKSFKERFKYVSTADWEKQGDDYAAEFNIGNNKGKAIYKETGNFVSSEIEIGAELVPDLVKTYIDANFKGLKIEYAKKFEFTNKADDYYYVTTPKTKDGKRFIPEFSINAKGKLINENFPEELSSLRKLEKPKEAEAKPAKEEKPTGKGVKEPKGKTSNAKEASAKESEPKDAKKEKGKGDKKDAGRASSIPQPVTDHFNKTFKQVANPDWEANDTAFICTFKSKEEKNYAVYNKKQEYVMTMTDIDIKNLPPPLAKCIVNNYAEYKLISALNVVTADKKKYTKMKLSQKQGKTELFTIVFTNPAGQVTKEIKPKGMETEEDKNRVSVNAIPKKVISSFNLKYPKSEDIKWTKSDSGFTVNCFFKGEKLTAIFSDSGQYVQSMKNLSLIKLPPPVQKYLVDNFKKEKMINAQFVERGKKDKYYYVEMGAESKVDKYTKVMKLKKLKLSNAGKLIDQTEDNVEVVDKQAVANQEAMEKAKQEKAEKDAAEKERLRAAKEEQEMKKAELNTKKKEEEAYKNQQTAPKESSKPVKEKKVKQKKNEDIDLDIDKDFKDTDKSKGDTKIEAKELPSKITDYINNNYKDPKRKMIIKEAKITTNSDGQDLYNVIIRWEDEVSITDELFFDTKGNFVKKK